MKLYTPMEVAEIAGVTKDMVYKEIRLGRLRHTYFGSLIRVSEKDLNNYLNERTKRHVQNRIKRKPHKK